MDNMTLYIPHLTPALRFAQEALDRAGIVPVSDGRNAGCWLFPVPTGEISEAPGPGTQVIGGKLDRPEFSDCTRLDLLEDAQYLAENARLTAECALRILQEKLPTSIFLCPILIIGWGRIGKCLAQLLSSMGARVVVAARKPADLGMLTALGYETVSMGKLPEILPRMRVVINTAPAPVLDEGELKLLPANGVKLDLASARGLAGEDVLWARGLPGKMLPEASGQLIARRVLTLLYNKEETV